MRYVVLTCAVFLALAGIVPAAMVECNTLAEAKAAAQAGQRDIMVLYTGSDWCPACVYLEKQILTQPAFEKAFGDRLVLLEELLARTPAVRSRIRDADMQRRMREMDAYRITSLPCVVLLDAQGRPYALVQGVDQTVNDYIGRLREAMAVKDRRDAALEAARKLSGLERARALAAALELLPEAVRDKYTDLLLEIVELDTGNTLGYNGRIHRDARMQEMRTAFREMRQGFAGKLQPEQLDACRRQVEDFMARFPDMEPDLRQQCYQLICDGYILKHDWSHAYEYVHRAISAAPHTELTGQLLTPLKARLEQLFPEQCRPPAYQEDSRKAEP